MNCNIGIMPEIEYRQRCLDIVSGALKPLPNEPKIWFNSIELLAEYLHRENREINVTIFEKNPESIFKLAEIMGKDLEEVLVNVSKLAKVGIVKLDGEGELAKPISMYSSFNIVILDDFN